LEQLARFRDIFEKKLIPRLADRTGLWVLGPTFAGSAFISTDADLIAAGLLLDLKTSLKFTLPKQDLFQLVGYALLDFDDEYGVTEVGLFSARYAYLATWLLSTLLEDLAGHKIDLQSTRQEFHELLKELTAFS
jgi:hypothetical protein